MNVPRRQPLAVAAVSLLVAVLVVTLVPPALASGDQPDLTVMCEWKDSGGRVVYAWFQFDEVGGRLEYQGLGGPNLGGNYDWSRHPSASLASQGWSFSEDGRTAWVSAWFYLDDNTDDWWPGSLVPCSGSGSI